MPMGRRTAWAVLATIDVIFSVSFPTGVSARTLHVTTHGGPVDLPAGPVQSYRLQDALDQVEPGDTVQLLGEGNRAAIYRAADIFRLTQSGEAGRPITIKGQVRDGDRKSTRLNSSH